MDTDEMLSMDAFTAIETRHSTREFTDRPVPRELIERMVDAGRRAPTARNEQPWLFVVVTEARLRKQIAELTDYGKFIAQAPACIVVFCKDTKYYLEDGCAAVENILIAATALGVQSCWVAGDKKAYCPKIAQMLNVPAGHKLIALLPIGYAAAAGRQKTRKGMGEVLKWERYEI
jgi:nitroreductase